MTVPPPAPEQAPPTVVVAVHVARGGHGRKHLRTGTPAAPEVAPAGRVPRVARMMALAVHWQGLVRAGTVRDQADLARLVGVTRARVTQVMDLLRLAPDLQEAVLNLPRTPRGRDPLHHRDLVRIAARPLWAEQRGLWSAAIAHPTTAGTPRAPAIPDIAPGSRGAATTST